MGSNVRKVHIMYFELNTACADYEYVNDLAPVACLAGWISPDLFRVNLNTCLSTTIVLELVSNV